MSGLTSQSQSSSWRTPSRELQGKFNLRVLKDDFEPTKEEDDLLEMYETIRTYEKEAARIKEQQARAKMDAKKAEYDKMHGQDDSGVTPTKKKKKKRRKEVEQHESGGDIGMDDASSDDEEEEEEDERTIQERREAKLAEWREEIESKQKKDAREKTEEEAMRAKLLQTEQADDQLGPSLKRKQMSPMREDKSALIANLSAKATPPHEFSKKVGLKAWEGKVLFPVSPDEQPMWKPPESSKSPTDGDLSFSLTDFDVSQAKTKGNNTIAIKYNAPIESKRFSINIAAPDHGQYESVLFHFNPRQFEKGGQLVLNNKQEGLWGQSIAVPLSRVPKIFGEEACTLLIQITEEGFDVFIEDIHCARLEHRQLLPASKVDLTLQFPSTDDYGNSENWRVYKVWWGHKDLLAKDLTDVYGVNAFSSMHPKKLFIKGISKISTEAEVELRRAELERAFRKYGGDRGVTVTAPLNVKFAFVECASEQQANMALEEMADQYDIKRARRTKHEALQEERAAAEATNAGTTKESTDW
jgi:hypothetical protein